MPKVQVELPLNRLSIQDKILLGRTVVTQSTASGHLPHPFTKVAP